jgi:hypothetical protein
MRKDLFVYKCSSCKRSKNALDFKDPLLPTECFDCIDKFNRKMIVTAERYDRLSRNERSEVKKVYIEIDNLSQELIDEVVEYFRENVGKLFRNKDQALVKIQSLVKRKYNINISYRTIRECLKCVKRRDVYLTQKNSSYSSFL